MGVKNANILATQVSLASIPLQKGSQILKAGAAELDMAPPNPSLSASLTIFNHHLLCQTQISVQIRF